MSILLQLIENKLLKDKHKLKQRVFGAGPLSALIYFIRRAQLQKKSNTFYHDSSFITGFFLK